MPTPRSFFPVMLTSLCACGGASSSTEPPVFPAPAAVAEVSGTQGHENVTGEVHFKQRPEGHVEVAIRLEGLPPGSRHGFHLHAEGDCTAPDASSAKGHFSPRGHDHGLPPQERHAGDFGNIQASTEGVVVDNIVVAGVSIDPEASDSVLGRAVILHADPDDGAGSSGHAGPRIACGVVGRD